MLHLFCRTGRRKIREGKNILQLMLPFLAGLALCMACLAGTTWAWFMDAASCHVAALNAATFSCTVTVQEMDFTAEWPQPIGDPLTARAYWNGERDVPASFTFNRNSSYVVTIAPGSEATASRGYCLVSFMDAEGNPFVYRTGEIDRDGTFTFTYQNGIPVEIDPIEQAELPAEPDTLHIFAYWGVYIPADDGFRESAQGDIPEIESGAVTGMPPAPPPLVTRYILGDYITLENEMLQEGNLYAVIRAAEGYALPETIAVTMNGEVFAVSTAGEQDDGQPWFDPESNTLVIPGSLLQPDLSGMIMVTIVAEAVAAPAPENNLALGANPVPMSEQAESQGYPPSP